MTATVQFTAAAIYRTSELRGLHGAVRLEEHTGKWRLRNDYVKFDLVNRTEVCEAAAHGTTPNATAVTNLHCDLPAREAVLLAACGKRFGETVATPHRHNPEYHNPQLHNHQSISSDGNLWTYLILERWKRLRPPPVGPPVPGHQFYHGAGLQ